MSFNTESQAALDAAITELGESFTLDNPIGTFSGIFQEARMQLPIGEYGDTEQIENTLVVSKTDFASKPLSNTEVTHGSDTYLVRAIDEDAISYTLMLTRKDLYNS